ncbi:S1 family peptidase [Paenibacillus qinlingensis]|uniref:S1 family peptidase n=1 Tax=Paenibacillus qinlingensis TaxID=1837343 RepID=UPI001565BED7|nr:serine protease [Paenibacillus qinlingensis]NQX60798.1 trypsin-like peptidase domain-containing protein [Paenibacillus qinlingensis]
MKNLRRLVIVLLGVLCVFMSHFTITGADPPETYDAEALYENAEKSVFYVRAFREDGTLKDVGTGFVVKPDGTALTAYHVIAGADRISCVWQEAAVEMNCSVVSQDETLDTAVLKLPFAQGSSGKVDDYAYLNTRKSKVKHGEKVYALGYPMKDTKIITEGIVNTPRANINGRDRILISAQIVNGMSGGPILDKYGNVIGLISGSLRTMNNIHLVVGSDDIHKILLKDPN